MFAAMPRILVAHQDLDARLILCAALEHAGYSPRALVDPDRVLEEACGCSLVVTDFPMRLSHGKTLTEALREHPPTADVPILNATTHAMRAELEAASHAGVTETLVLPTALGDILAMVRRLVGLPDASATAPPRSPA